MEKLPSNIEEQIRAVLPASAVNPHTEVAPAQLREQSHTPVVESAPAAQILLAGALVVAAAASFVPAFSKKQK